MHLVIVWLFYSLMKKKQLILIAVYFFLKVAGNHRFSSCTVVSFFFSILDQQQKQTIPFQGGVFLENFDGKVFIASGRAVYSLVPVAWEKQVCILITYCPPYYHLHDTVETFEMEQNLWITI